MYQVLVLKYHFIIANKGLSHLFTFLLLEEAEIGFSFMGLVHASNLCLSPLCNFP